MIPTIKDHLFFIVLAIPIVPLILIAGVCMYCILAYDKLRGRDTMIGMRGTFGNSGRFK